MYVYVRGYMVGMALLLEMCIALSIFSVSYRGGMLTCGRSCGCKVFFGTHLANPALHSSIIEMFSVCISASPELRRHTGLEE